MVAGAGGGVAAAGGVAQLAPQRQAHAVDAAAQALHRFCVGNA
jgi:hypothetical protein